MQVNCLRACRFLALLLPIVMSAESQQVTVDYSGSTNQPGLTVTFDQKGQATVSPPGAEVQHVTLPEPLCKQFMQDLEAAGPLNDLPAVHCMKSASFGSSTFVEFQGKRSPDLSCPAGQDPHSLALKKDAEQLLRAAREAAHLPSSRHFLMVPAPRPQ